MSTEQLSGKWSWRVSSVKLQGWSPQLSATQCGGQALESGMVSDNNHGDAMLTAHHLEGITLSWAVAHLLMTLYPSLFPTYANEETCSERCRTSQKWQS